MTQTPPPIEQIAETQLPASQPRKIWPAVIGVIALVFAGLGAVSYVFVIVAAFFADAFPEGNFEQPISMWLTLPIGLAATVLLAAGGITLLKRQPIARILLLITALVKIVLIVISTVNLVGMEQFDKPELAHMKPIMLFSSLWGLIFPVFLLIWLNREAIRTEVAQWASAPGDAGLLQCQPLVEAPQPTASPEDASGLPAEQLSPTQEVQQSAWPIAIGVISLLIAVFFAMGSLITLPVLLHMGDKRVLIIVIPIIAIMFLAPTTLLAWAASGLFRRRRLGRTLHLIYAWIFTCLGILMLFFQMATFHGPEGLFPGLLSAVMLMAYPIFLLIWFSRKKIKDEVRSWGEPEN